MPVRDLACANCGAPLTFPEETKYVTCNFCGAQLTVESTESASYTKVLELQQETTNLKREIDVLKMREKIRLVDEGWKKTQKRFLIRDSQGRATFPNRSLGVAFAVVAVAAVLLGIIIAINAGELWFAGIGLLIAAFFGRGRDIEDHDLIGALRFVEGGAFCRIAGIAQALKLDALDHPAMADIEARNDPPSQVRRARR